MRARSRWLRHWECLERRVRVGKRCVRRIAELRGGFRRLRRVGMGELSGEISIDVGRAHEGSGRSMGGDVS